MNHPPSTSAYRIEIQTPMAQDKAMKAPFFCMLLSIAMLSTHAQAQEESFADNHPILVFSVAAFATIGVASQIREGFQFSGDNRPIGGYILGGLYAIPPFLPSGGTDTRTQPHKTATAMAFFGLSIYNFIYMTADDITTDKILVHNVVGFSALMAYLWGISKVFHPIQSYDIGAYVFPSMQWDREGLGHGSDVHSTGLLNIAIPIN